MPRKIVFGGLGELYHSLVRLLRRGAEREDAVVHQHHADSAGAGFRGKTDGAGLRKIEAGHHVWDHYNAVAVDFPDPVFATRGIRDGEYGVRVRVIHVAVRQYRMQNRLDRWRGRRRSRHVRDELVHHLWIAQCLEPGELEQVLHPYRREAGFLDEFEVPSAAFDVEDLFVLADEIALRDLCRCIPAAVQHERLIAAEQTRGINAQAEIALELQRLGVAPQALHGADVNYNPAGERVGFVWRQGRRLGQRPGVPACRAPEGLRGGAARSRGAGVG